MFVEDPKVYKVLEEFNMSNSLQEDLERLEFWVQNMQLLFHPENFKVLHLGSNNPHYLYTMMAGGGALHTLLEVHEVKDLSIVIDNQLLLSNHIQYQVIKTNRIL